MSDTITPTPKLFGRLGTRKDIDRQIKLAKQNTIPSELEIKENKEYGTVEVKFKGEILFNAISKDVQGKVWIVTYNKKFYAQ